METSSAREAKSGGAVAAAHPRATEVGLDILRAGGNAVDAAVAAQAMICVLMPQAAGLGGDVLALVHEAGTTTAINGVGLSPAAFAPPYTTDGGNSVTVPGLVDGWMTLHERWGTLPLATLLTPAIAAAQESRVDVPLMKALNEQRERLLRYGGEAWALLGLHTDDIWHQPELAALLQAIASDGAHAFYHDGAEAIVRAVRSHGGTLDVADLHQHQTLVNTPRSVAWGARTLQVQPSPTQGVLLAMAAQWLDRQSALSDLDHLAVEATAAAFGYRDSVNARTDLLKVDLDVSTERASNRGGPRAYLHTAGVATVDADGLTVSSLISVFDDFGSAVYVPELGIVLGNRAAGFTNGDNAPAPSSYPVHTLAPAMLIDADGTAHAIATPGADGQVQTLLQVLISERFRDLTLAEAIARPRWRSQSGSLLVEDDHPATGTLAALGHRIEVKERGDNLFGAVVAAGIRAGSPYAHADWRRRQADGVA